MAADSEPLGSISDTDHPFCFATAITPWRASVDVGSELAKETIPIVYFLPAAAEAREVVLAALAAARTNMRLDCVRLDEVVLRAAKPTAGTATTTTARATPTAVRKCLLDTTFSSPAV